MVKSLRFAFLMLATCFAVVANAQNVKSYTENLVVTVNEMTTDPQATTVYVETLENGNINFTLNNFILSTEDGEVAVGNIAIKNLAVEDKGYCKTFSYNDITLIEAGDDPEFDFWMGPNIGEIPLKLEGKMTDDKLYVTIDIDMMATLEQVIYVKLGEDIEEPAGPAVVSSKEYTENLVVTINDISTDPQPTAISVETLENGNINFTLNNFILSTEDGEVAVGNIAIKNLALEDKGYCKTFSYNDITLIEAGDNPEFDFWMGPNIGEIPLKLEGKMTDDKLYVTIDIDMMATLEQVIYVKLGEDILDPVEVSISSATSAPKATATFDLSGRRVSNAVKGGVYVENGKKIIK